MLNAVVVDAQDVKEAGEAEIVSRLLQRTTKVVVKEEHGSALDWYDHPDLIWFAGHASVYKKSNKGSLDVRRGSVFRRVWSADHVKTFRTSLLVLSACHTVRGPFAGDYAAKWVIGYDGPLDVDDSLLFAVAFMTEFTSRVRKNRVADVVVKDSFLKAVDRVRDDRWCLKQRSDSR